MPKPILLLEDTQQNLAELSTALRDAGYDAVVLEADDDPVLQFSVIRPELIFLSLLAENATNACGSIRDDPDGAIVPIVFVGTGKESVTSPADALAAGGDFYFELPIDVQKVLAKVKTYVGVGNESPTTPPPDPSPLEAKASPRPLEDDEDTVVGPPPPSAFILPELAWTRGEATEPENTALIEASDALLAELQQEEKKRDDELSKQRTKDEEAAREARRHAIEEARRRAENEARELDEARRRQDEEEEATRKRLETEAEQKRKEEEERKQLEEEKRRQEEEATRKRLEAEAEQKRKEEEEREQLEEEKRRQEEEATRKRLEAEAEQKRKEEEEREQLEEEKRRQEAEATRKRLEAEAEQKRKEEEERKQLEEEKRRQEEEEAEHKRRTAREAFLAAERARQEESRAKAKEEAERLLAGSSEQHQAPVETETDAHSEEEPHRSTAVTINPKPTALPTSRPRSDDGPMAPPRPAPRSGAQHDGSIPALSAPREESGSFGGSKDLATVLYEFWCQKITGRVDFQSGGRQKSFFFERGGPVDAYSSQLFDRMEEFLYRHGKITRAQYQNLRVKQIRGSRRIAAYSVSEGFLKPPELFEAVRNHLEEVVYGLFEWQEGTFQYVSEYAEEDDRVILDMDPRAIIVEGVRRKYLLAHLMDRVGAPSSLLSPTGELELDALDLTAEERHVVRLVDGTRSVEDLVFSTGLDALGVYHVLASLLFMGYAEVTIRGIEGMEADGTSTGDIIDRDRIRDKLDHVRTLDYFQVLGVPRTATTYEVERAFSRVSQEFEEVRFSDVIRRDMHQELQEIERVLDDAREVLKNDVLRDAYARSVS